MKKLLLFLVAIGACLIGVAQKRVPVSKELTQKAFVRHYEQFVDLPTDSKFVGNTSYQTKEDEIRLGDETEIIETVYDLQTNKSLSNRIWVWEDGTIAAVTMRGIQAPAFPERGTGYNYYNGNSWGPKPTNRIESVRTGWPSIAALGVNGEIVASHMATAYEQHIVINKRQTKGQGTWQESIILGPQGAKGILWPRIVASGENNDTVHVLAVTTPISNGGNPFMGQDGALVYYRSTDAANTWDIQGVLLDGLGAAYYNQIESDSYVLASKGNTIAFLVASAWYDMFIFKSTDNGDTWQKSLIWEHPYPFFDLNTTLTDDTLYAVDNSANIAIDNNGMVHVVWGIGRVARLAANPPAPGSYTYWPFTDGIGYWNESMGQIPEANNPHHTMKPDYLEPLGMLVGWTQDVNGSGYVFDFEGTADPPFNVYRSLGISTMPTITIDNNGVVVVAYASVTETYITSDALHNYHHIWCRASNDLGNTWGEFYDLQANNIFHIYDECIYPVFPATSHGNMFDLIYQADNKPGLFLDDDHEPVTNRVIHQALTYDLLGISPYFPAPYNLTAVLDTETGLVNLGWSFNSKSDDTLNRNFLYFNVYRNNTLIATTNNFDYTDQLTGYGTYDYMVKAQYTGGESNPAGPVQVIWQGIPDISVTPLFFEVFLEPGETSTHSLTIQNSGDDNLIWSLSIIMPDNKSQKGAVLSHAHAKEEPSSILKNEPDLRKGEPVLRGHGGPDQFGYTWVDSSEPGGPVFNWQDISNTGNIVEGLVDDNWVGPFPISFDFPFYENSYDEFFISSNGFISFGAGNSSLFNIPIPSQSLPNNFVAWCWDDLYPNNFSFVYFQNFTDRIIVQFKDYSRHGFYDSKINAQIILFQNGKIIIQYLDVSNDFPTAHCTIGIENSEGNDGLQVAYNTPYIENNLALQFNTPATWLIPDIYSGIVPADGSMDIMVLFNATELIPGIHTAEINISSNDPDDPLVTVPVTLTVDGLIPPTNLTANLDSQTGVVELNWNFQLSTGFLFFNVYRDDELIGNATETDYSDSLENAGTYIYRVSATYDEGESMMSNPAPVTWEGIPDISVTPDALFEELEPGETSTQQLTIHNYGSGDLFFILNIENNLALQFRTSLSWIFADLYSGSVSPGDFQSVNISFDAGELIPGIYNAEINIMSNDPNEPLVTIPVTLTVEGLIPPTNLAAVLNTVTGEVELIWNFQPGNSFLFFNVYRDDELIGTTTETDYSDSLENAGTYIYEVSAMYDEGESMMSNPAPVTWEVFPDISVTPDTLFEELEPGETSIQYLTITNNGNGELNWSSSLISNESEKRTTELFIQHIHLTKIAQDASGGLGWLAVTPTNGVIPPASSETIAVNFDATNLAPDIYTADINISSNDPVQPVVTIPVTLHVTVSLLIPPSNLAYELVENDVHLTWSQPSTFPQQGKDLLGYNVYRNYEKLNQYPITDTTHIDLALTANSYLYFVTAVYDEGESFPSNIVTVLITNINEVLKNAISIYPNPTNGLVSVNSSLFLKTISVLTFSGQFMYSSLVSDYEFKLDTKGFQSGIYLIKLETATDTFYKKLIVR